MKGDMGPNSHHFTRGRRPVEAKVKWAGIATYLATTGGLAVLQGVTDVELVDALPPALAPFVLALLPALVALLAGYQAPHTSRGSGGGTTVHLRG